jgi:hypothetical protein
MAKNVADDLCGRATINLETSVRVTKDVGPNTAADTSSTSVISDAVSNCRRRHSRVRHRTLNKERSTGRSLWASFTDVRHHSPCDGR